MKRPPEVGVENMTADQWALLRVARLTAREAKHQGFYTSPGSKNQLCIALIYILDTLGEETINQACIALDKEDAQ